MSKHVSTAAERRKKAAFKQSGVVYCSEPDAARTRRCQRRLSLNQFHKKRSVYQTTKRFTGLQSRT